VVQRTFGVGQSDTRGLMWLDYWGVVGLELDTDCCIRDRFIARKCNDGIEMYVDVSLCALAILMPIVNIEPSSTDYKGQENKVDDAAVVDECVATIQPRVRTCSRGISLSEVGYRMSV
jgi:hypothetical protein